MQSNYEDVLERASFDIHCCQVFADEPRQVNLYRAKAIMREAVKADREETLAWLRKQARLALAAPGYFRLREQEYAYWLKQIARDLELHWREDDE